MKLSELTGKNILLWGFGVEGQTTLDSLYDKLSAQWFIFSDSPPAKKYTEKSSDRSHLLFSDALDSIDCVIKSPGISLYDERMSMIRQQGIAVTSATNIWFSERSSTENTIVITGTKGKSTTATLVKHLLEEAGHAVRLCGNIGVPLLQHVDDTAVDYWVIELSSYQLADFSGEVDTAMILNLMPEHLNWHGSLPQYYADKTRVIEFIKPGGTCITSQTSIEKAPQLQLKKIVCYDSTQSVARITEDTLYYQEHQVSLLETAIRGTHNYKNLQAAISLINSLGVTIDSLQDSLARFTPLPHRMNIIAEFDGITYVDDSISTIPETSVAALQAFADKPSIIILGGYDRGIDWSSFPTTLLQSTARGIVCTGTNGMKIANLLQENNIVEKKIIFQNVFDDAVQAALKEARSGEYVILSPGAPSLDTFPNFKERGKRFAELIHIFHKCEL